MRLELASEFGQESQRLGDLFDAILHNRHDARGHLVTVVHKHAATHRSSDSLRNLPEGLAFAELHVVVGVELLGDLRIELVGAVLGEQLVQIVLDLLGLIRFRLQKRLGK